MSVISDREYEEALRASGLPDRIWRQIEVDGDCWVWTGHTVHNGYGSCHWQQRDWRVHRLIYTAVVGNIPVGMQIDHLCHVRRCVNPAHLRPVLPRANSENLRGAHRDSTTGVRGVRKVGQRYTAEVCSRGRRYWLGSFQTISEAEDAVVIARNRLMENNLVDRRSA